MDWYRVVKTIKGRKYDYWQKTYRVGRHVKTLNKYIGPHREYVPVPRIPDDAYTLPLPFPVPALPIAQFNEKAFKLLTETPTKDVNWWHHWTRQSQSETKVQRIKKIDEVIERLPVKWSQRSDGCYFSPHKDLVNVPRINRFFDTELQSATQAYYVVVFHELIHWTHGPSRLNRREFKNYAVEELVAELGALTLMEHYGLGVGDYARHAVYFQTWLSRVPPINREEALDRQGADTIPAEFIQANAKHRRAKGNHPFRSEIESEAEAQLSV